MTEQQQHIQQKKLAIAESIIYTASIVSGLAKQLPKTGKRRNIFVKSYSRRPQNKGKRAVIMSQMAFAAYIGASQLGVIASQPMPKFQKGGVAYEQ